MFARAEKADRRLARYDHLIVHVTATRPTQDLDDEDIDRMHRARGFSGCGYNALITRDGRWLDSDMGAVTRPIGEQGAHVGGCGAGWNGRSFGVSLVGGVDDHLRPEFNMTDAQMKTLREGITKFLDLHPKGAGHVVVMGHRDLIALTNAPGKKACPCFDVIPWWTEHAEPTAPEPDEDAQPDLPTSPMDVGGTWTVKRGDTLGAISRISGVPMTTLMQINPDLNDPDRIEVGQTIRLA